ncbi:MAG: nicotinamide-nucleotide amidohydrolase family protein [Rhizobiaceae bacterium]|nr:nicotinamide-nucleotide amidohydrolase family protein [Rhizobiaceae bacterium]
MSSSVAAIHAHFVARRLTLSTAESLTGGNIQAAITAQSGASRFFLGGVTAYTIPVKAKILGIDRAMAEACNAVSAEVAEQMAMGACRVFGSDVAIATTGYAEPAPEAGVEQPFAHVAIWREGRAAPLASETFRGAGLSRSAMQRETTDAAVDALAALIRKGSI